jgi:hypothetical protein
MILKKATLIFKLPSKLIHSYIADCPGQIMISHQALHIQIFNGYRLVFTAEPSRELVKKIISLALYLSMQPDKSHG